VVSRPETKLVAKLAPVEVSEVSVSLVCFVGILEKGACLSGDP